MNVGFVNAKGAASFSFSTEDTCLYAKSLIPTVHVICLKLFSKNLATRAVGTKGHPTKRGLSGPSSSLDFVNTRV